MSTKKVHNAPIKPYLRDLHGALIEIVSAMNRPQRDDDLMQEAGVTLDRALFRPVSYTHLTLPTNREV